MTLAFLTGGMPGMVEIGIIGLVLVLLFGAKRLPQLARALGASLTEFKKGRNEQLLDGKEARPEDDS